MCAVFLPDECADRPGTALGIPCFHAEFPIVRGAENDREDSLLGNTLNPQGEYSKSHNLRLELGMESSFLNCES